MTEVEKNLALIQEFQNKHVYYPDAFFKYVVSCSYDEHTRLPHPEILVWDLVNFCNLKCYFCSANSGKYNSASQQLVDYRKVLSFIEACKPSYVTLRGGEPSLHPDFCSILEWFATKYYFLEIVSNGVGINEKVSQIFSRFDQDKLRVKISLDSIDEKANDMQRGKGSFQNAINAIKTLGNYKIKNVRVQMVVTENNVDGVYDLYKALHNFNVSSFGANALTPSGASKDLNIRVMNDKLLEQLVKCIDLYDKTRKIAVEKCHIGYYPTMRRASNLIEDKEIDPNRIFKIKCVAGNLKLNIDANGDVYPCDFLKFNKFKLGTVMSKFEDIWNSETMNYLYNFSREDKKECATCKNFSCNTGCMGFAFEKYGTIKRKDPNCIYDSNVL